MPTTTVLNSASTQATGQYKRTLNVASFSNIPDNQEIIPSGGKSTTVSAMWIQDSLVVPGAAFQSDNSTSGITFIALQRKSNGTPYDSITLNVGPTPGASGATNANQDYGDSIYIDSGNRYTSAVKNSTIIAGNQTSYQDTLTYGANAKDNDLIFFGNEQSTDGSTYPISLPVNGSVAFTATIKYADGAGSLPITIDNNKIYTGKDEDTLIFANTAAGTSITNNYLSLGTGADFVYFAQPSSIGGGNIISLGNQNKTADTSADTLCFNYSAAASKGSVLGVNGTSTFITVEGFQDGQDRLYYNGVFYSTQQSVISASWNAGRIRFDNGPA